MCCSGEESESTRKFFSLSLIAVCVSIVLETSLISLHIYAYHQTLVHVFVDEIFFVITAVFLVLSICWLFVSSWDFIYSHFRVIRGFQAVVMIVNGSMLILAAVRTRHSENCQQIRAEGLECQQFETRIFIGCLALMNGIFYFFRRPIYFAKEERFYPPSLSTVKSQSPSKMVTRRKFNKSHNILDVNPRWHDLKTESLPCSNPMLITVENDFDCILKVDVSEGRRQSQQGHQGQGEGRDQMPSCSSDTEESHATTANSLTDLMNMNVSKSPNSFYYNCDQEYFLPNVEIMSPKNPRYSQECYSTLTRDMMHSSDGFA